MSVSLTIAASAVLLACVVYLSVTLIKAFLTFRRRTRVLYDLPGEPPHWLWGHLKMYPGPNDEGLAWQRQQTEKFPRVSIAWLGPFLPQVVVCHPDTVRLILKTSEPKGEMTYELIRPWVGDGLLLSKGHKWLRNRRLLTPAFHFDILKPYMAVNNQAADIFLSKVQSHSEKGEYFELFGNVSMYTLDVILRCAFSYNTDCQYLGDQHPYVKAVNDLSSLSTDRFFKPWFHNKFLYSLTPNGRKFQRACNFVHQVSENIVNRRKKELEAVSSSETDKRKRYLDFLDILLTARDEEGAGLKDTEIRDEVDTFLFEGHDTTASAICWTLFSLAENPEHQTLIHREIEEILKGRQSKEILWEDLPKLTYLTMCIKEALRLHTPVSFIQRQTTQPLTVDGVTIPADTLFNVVLYNVHHNPEIWEDSLEYRPERFSKENVDNRDPYAFLPFSAGPRNCIGQNFAMHEIKVLIARVVYSFSLVADKSQKPSKSVEVVVRSKNGVWVKAVPRQSRD